MSRVGRQPVMIPSGVSVNIDNAVVNVSGSKGSLSQPVLSGVILNLEDGTLKITRKTDERRHRSNHGLMRTQISNMVDGVSQGFSKTLEVNGVGFRASLQGSGLKLTLGYSHEISFPLPEGISATVEQNVITISGIDKQKVGQVAAEIRALRKPEPYKGKGIKYQGEYIIRKSGKSGKEK